MTNELVAIARRMREQGQPWKAVAKSLDVNVNTLIYQLRHKGDPRYAASRKRSFNAWALKSGRKRAPQ